MPTEYATDRGLAWLWVTFAIMATSALLIGAITFLLVPSTERTHGYLTTAILVIASTAYYSMAIDRGYTVAGVASDPLGVGRSVYWARYVDWFLTTPLLLLEVLIYSGISLSRTLWIIGADLAMILLGLFAALDSAQKFRWGYYGVSCLMQLCIINGLITGWKYTSTRGPKTRSAYLATASYLSLIWLGYPIVFGLAEGSNTISVFAEIGAYSVLDLLTKVVFGWAIVGGIFLLLPEYKQEYKDGKFLPDVYGAPVYAPLSTTRHPNEDPLGGEKYIPQADRQAGGALHPPTNTAPPPVAQNV